MDRTTRLAPLLLLAALLACPAAGAAPAAPAAPPLDAASRNFHQVQLDIVVKPNLHTGVVEGRVTNHFRSLVDGLDRLRLHCEDTRVRAVHDAAGHALEHKLDHGVLTVPLARPLADGEDESVTIDYTSTPKRGLYFHGPTSTCPTTPWFLYSQGEGTDNRRWIPCYDEPDDRCSWSLTVTAPADLKTVSNGLLARVEQGKGTHTDRWEFDGRAPTYLISLIVAPLETLRTKWRDVTLEFNAVPGHHDALASCLGQTAAMMEFYSTYLQAPYPWPRYAQTFVWDFVYGGMENVTATTLNMRALISPAVRPNYRSEGLVAHELAHMWFGDLLTCRTWKHIWLNEGFATYFNDLFVEHHDGEDEFLMQRRNENRGYMKRTPHPADLKLEKDDRGDIPTELFGGKQYSRGAGILNELRHALGADVFRDAMRAWVARHRDSAVTSEELRRTVEDVAGEDLSWFWDQWVYGIGYPKLDVRYDARAKRLVVRQTQRRAGGQGLFRLRVPIRWGKDGPVQELAIRRAEEAFPMERGGPFLRFGVGGDRLMQVTLHQDADAWRAELAQDPDVTGRLDAAEALEGFGARGTAALTQALAHDASQAVRRDCAQILGRLDGSQATAALLAATSDKDPRVREAVYDALGSRTRAEAGAQVLAGVQDDPHPYVRAAAARSLGRLKVKGAFDVLRGLLNVDSDQDVVRMGAAQGLAQLGDGRAVPILLPYLAYRWGKGGNHRLREAVFHALLKLAPDAPAVHAAVIALLKDPYPRARAWAARACGTYGMREAIPALRHVRDEDRSGGVKGAARKALDDLGWKEPPPVKATDKKAGKKAG